MRKPTKNTIPIKTYKSIFEIYNLIKTKQYTEKHIKDLLIDLRFIATSSKIYFKNSKFEEGINEFIDFCNFIAHPVKDRGFIAKRIIENIDLLNQSLINPTELQFENGNIYFDKLKTYSTGNYITYMFTFLFLVLGEKIPEDELKLIHRKEEKDIALCILSLLQNSIIELDNKDIEKAVLILNSNDGYLYLFSIIYSDKINEKLIQSGYNPGADSSFFLLPAVGSNITHIKVHQEKREFPQFYETYREPNNQLNIRLI